MCNILYWIGIFSTSRHWKVFGRTKSVYSFCTYKMKSATKQPRPIQRNIPKFLFFSSVFPFPLIHFFHIFFRSLVRVEFIASKKWLLWEKSIELIAFLCAHAFCIRLGDSFHEAFQKCIQICFFPRHCFVYWQSFFSSIFVDVLLLCLYVFTVDVLHIWKSIENNTNNRSVSD